MLFGKSESGRTLVEMLGVMMMIGLLTVGGLQWYGTAIAKMELNDLLTEVRKRALAVAAKGAYDAGGNVVNQERKHRNVYTYGMFDKSNVSRGCTAYGYGVGDNKSTPSVARKTIDGVSLVLVPVGKVNDGNALSKGVCKALLGMVEDKVEQPVAGTLMGVYVKKKRRGIE